MTQFDVFNGDADGLCALQQIRLARPGESVLVTGVKRDIKLLGRVAAAPGDTITVLDVSLDSNREALTRTLAAGAEVRWFDHHFPGEIPTDPRLDAHIDPSPETCTSIIVDRWLGGAHRAWAVTGAFGDNFYDLARRTAAPLALTEAELEALKELGTCLNYNGYGMSVEDLWFAPDRLAAAMLPYADPLEFIAQSPDFVRLRDGYREDMANTEALAPMEANDRCALFLLPDEPWVRRVSGELGNLLARSHPARAHAVVTHHPDGGYRVSVRAPHTSKTGADRLCLAFPTGGGRAAAAGINQLPEELFGQFVDAFKAQFGG